MQKMTHQLAGSGGADLGNDLQGEEGEEVGRVVCHSLPHTSPSNASMRRRQFLPLSACKDNRHSSLT